MLRLSGQLAVDSMFEISCVCHSPEFGLADSGAEEGDQSGSKPFVGYILPADDIIDLLNWDLAIADVEEAVF